MDRAPQHLRAGDKIQYCAEGVTLYPVVQENTSWAFTWRGGLPLVLKAHHVFRFTESAAFAGGTLFDETEEFAGALAGQMEPGKTLGERTLKRFRVFQEALKKRAEEIHAKRGTGAGAAVDSTGEEGEGDGQGVVRSEAVELDDTSAPTAELAASPPGAAPQAGAVPTQAGHNAEQAASTIEATAPK